MLRWRESVQVPICATRPVSVTYPVKIVLEGVLFSGDKLKNSVPILTNCLQKSGKVFNLSLCGVSAAVLFCTAHSGTKGNVMPQFTAELLHFWWRFRRLFPNRTFPYYM